MAQPNKPAKTMSSRLSTMKFMQRAAASSPSSSPSTPPEPSAKRQRLSIGSYNSTPASTPRSDAQVAEATLAAEEQKRKDAFDSEAASRGETKWYLSYKEPNLPPVKTPLRIVSAGYAALDAPDIGRHTSTEEDDDGSSRPQIQGRRSFGKFNRRIEKQQDPEVSSSDSSSDSESSESGEVDEDDSDDPTGAKAMITQSRKEAGDKARTERKAKRKAGKAEFERLADERRKKQVKLNKLSSISGTGGREDVRSEAKRFAYERHQKVPKKNH